tara:strand:- start:144 stop:407 length:264 start_codon:yes stop_codon:yes gene_type:complete
MVHRMAFAGTSVADITADYKNKRFIVAANNLEFGSATVVLVDFAFWTKHTDELNEWLTTCTPTAENHGTIVDIKSQEDLTLFRLRWA